MTAVMMSVSAPAAHGDGRATSAGSSGSAFGEALGAARGSAEQAFVGDPSAPTTTAADSPQDEAATAADASPVTGDLASAVAGALLLADEVETPSAEGPGPATPASITASSPPGSSATSALAGTGGTPAPASVVSDPGPAGDSGSAPADSAPAAPASPAASVSPAATAASIAPDAGPASATGAARAVAPQAAAVPSTTSPAPTVSSGGAPAAPARDDSQPEVRVVTSGGTSPQAADETDAADPAPPTGSASSASSASSSAPPTSSTSPAAPSVGMGTAAAAMPTAGALPIAPTDAPEASSATTRAVAAQVSPVIVSIAQRPAGTHQLTMTVNPDSLGPVTLRAHIGAGGEVQVELFGGTDAGRDALRMIATDLRRDLASVIPTATLSVAQGALDDGGAGRSSTGDGGASADQGAGREPRPDARGERRPGEHASGAAPRPQTTAPAAIGAGLDIFA